MRPAGRGPLESLYFNYPHFDPPLRDNTRVARQRVVIAGAGPVGQLAALALASHGIESVLLEEKATFNDGSRAICVARQSFHILEQVGAVQACCNKALGWTTGRNLYRGTQILEFSMPHSQDDKYLPMYNLQQQYLEQFLWEAIERNPRIDMRWQSPVEAVADCAEGVRVTVAHPDGDYTIETDWLLAADGARSPIRAMRGLRLKGENHQGTYVIADVRMEHPYPTIRRALFDPAANRGATVLIHRQPENIWRVDYQIGSDESIEGATAEPVVTKRVSAILEEIGHRGPWELEWWSAYSANTLALDEYRDGRVFFLGDSAHIVPIFGVRGLNNGLADAANIAWKLAMVIKNEAGARLLDSYTPERRGATLDVFLNATKSTRFMTPPSIGWRLVRDAALSLALRHKFAGAFSNPRQMAPHSYSDSPATLPDAAAGVGGSPPGAVLANVRLDDGRYLTDLLGPGFSGVWCTSAASHFNRFELQSLLEKVDPRFRLLETGVDFTDTDRRVAVRLGIPNGGFYLVRPDLHVAGRWINVHAESIAAALAAILDRAGG